jgi:hypothetical protein
MAAVTDGRPRKELIVNANLPARKLPERPDLDQLKRQAKELRDGFVAGESGAVAEVLAYYRDSDPSRFALHDAQLVLARAYGFDSWPKLKACVDGVTATRLHDAVEKGDLDAVRDVLRRRPEIVNRYRPHHGDRLPLHVAVANRDAAMTRLLMEHGADARAGIWPYRNETQALTMATERGYDDIAAIIQGVEAQREKSERDPAPVTPEIDPATSAIVRGDAAWIRARHAGGTLVNPTAGNGLLTLAVRHDQPEIVALLLELGFDPDERRREPGADEIVLSWGRPLAECTESGKLEMAQMLLQHGADANAWACVWNAYRQRDTAMIELLERYGGVPNAATPGYLRDTELAARKRCSTRRPAPDLPIFCAWRWSESTGRATIRAGSAFWPPRYVSGTTFPGSIQKNGIWTAAPIFPASPWCWNDVTPMSPGVSA